MHDETPLATLLAEDRGEAPERGVPLIPWSFLGMGLLIAWLCCTHLPNMFLAMPGIPAAAGTLADYAMRAGDIAAFLAVAVFAGRIGPLSRRRWACVAAICLSAACTLLIPLVVGRFGAAHATVPLGLLAGVGGAVLFCLWAEAYGQLGPTRCILHGSLSCVAAGLVALVVSHLDEGAANVAIACLPLLSGACAAVSLGRLPGEGAHRALPIAPGPGSQDGAAGKVRYPVPWKLVVLMALAGFASGFAGALLVNVDGMGAVHRIMATTVFGALLFALFVWRRGDFDVRLLARSTLAVGVAAFVSIPLAGSVAGAAVSFLIKFAYVAFALFVLLVLANVVWRHDIPSARVFASARAASEGAMLAGILLRRWMRESGALDSDTMLWLITIIGLVVIMGCVVLWHSERSVTSDWGTLGIDPASGLHVQTDRERLLARADAVADAHGLTPREREIFELLAEGHEPRLIEQELVLSHNTLKTHLRHIYTKLGVHTRAEAVGLVAE